MSPRVSSKGGRTNSGLNQHYEEKVRPCIDLVDSLRSLGVEKDLNLPAIAVIGDQSSGKSSVLEALSGVALPRGTGIVTRCPLVLKLKKVTKDATWHGSLSYKDQIKELKDPTEIENAVLNGLYFNAQIVLAGKGEGISHEMITLEIQSSDVPDLTLIDLPGIARVATGNQPKDIEKQIKDLIEKFIKRQETISLVVVPANIDIATTEALQMAFKVDSTGQRTLGILTKPDLVDKGMEETVLRTKIRQFNDALEGVKRAEEDLRNSKMRVFTKIREEFAKWKCVLDDKTIKTEEIFRDEVEEYVRTRRGKELPGFVNYRTFENIVKKHIEELEEPALKMLKSVTDIVHSCVNCIVSSHFKAFAHLLRAAKEPLEDLLDDHFQRAEEKICSQFRMERIVYSQDRLYSSQLETVKQKQSLTVLGQKAFVSADVREMAQHLTAYFKITSDRLANQIPLIVQYHMLDQYISQLQNAMLGMIGRNNPGILLQEDSAVERKRKELKERLGRLRSAGKVLSKILVHLSRGGAEVQMFAPDVSQMHVIDHGKGQPVEKESRNVLSESARIARGSVTDLAKLNVGDHDAVIFPGGFGAAKNLSTFASDGKDCKVNKEVERVLKGFHKAGKPIGLCCISPVLAAKVLPGVDVTVGHEEEEASSRALTGSVTHSLKMFGLLVNNQFGGKISRIKTGSHMLLFTIGIQHNTSPTATQTGRERERQRFQAQQ
ncbi:Mx [Labeo rohita]|uniref:Mx n=1 Tax=Labeo rohita TaxID=84645 RepID=A0A498N7V6_LABRO|nr:Mx [Labeo rohita]